jgi:hypothetical protein
MKRLIVVTLIVLLLIVASTALAQPGGGASTAPGTGYDLTWNTIDGGGGASAGGGYILGGSIGQPDAGPAMNGSGYSLAGGFWAGVAVPWETKVYLPLITRQPL